VDERALRQAREQLAGDAHIAALLAAGDPAAERAALALAINAGSSAQGRRGAEGRRRERASEGLFTGLRHARRLCSALKAGARP
jgi:hypothetical protein